MSRDTFSSGGDFIEFSRDAKAEIIYGRHHDNVKTETFRGVRKMIIKVYGEMYDFTFIYEDKQDQSVFIVNSSDFVSLKLERE